MDAGCFASSAPPLVVLARNKKKNIYRFVYTEAELYDCMIILLLFTLLENIFKNIKNVCIPPSVSSKHST